MDSNIVEPLSTSEAGVGGNAPNTSSSKGDLPKYSFLGAELLSEMRLTTGVSHYAERMAPGITSRVSSLDFTAITQGVLRTLLSLKNEEGSKYLGERFVLPELRVGPPPSLFADVVKLLPPTAFSVPPNTPLPGGVRKEQRKLGAPALASAGASARGRLAIRKAGPNAKKASTRDGAKVDGNTQKVVPGTSSKANRKAGVTPSTGPSETLTAVSKLKKQLLSKCLRSTRSKYGKLVCEHLGITEDSVRSHISSLTDEQLRGYSAPSEIPPLVRVGLINIDDPRLKEDWAMDGHISNMIRTAQGSIRKSRGETTAEQRQLSEPVEIMQCRIGHSETFASFYRNIHSELERKLGIQRDSQEKVFLRIKKPDDTTQSSGYYYGQMEIVKRELEVNRKYIYPIRLGQRPSARENGVLKTAILGMNDASSLTKYAAHPYNFLVEPSASQQKGQGASGSGASGILDPYPDNKKVKTGPISGSESSNSLAGRFSELGTVDDVKGTKMKLRKAPSGRGKPFLPH